MKQVRHIVAAALLALGAPAISLAAPVPTSDSGLDAFAGRWRIDLAQTRMGRMGPNGNNLVRDPTFTWQFTPIAGGLRMDVYSRYPQPAPTRTMTLITDAKARGCTTTGGCLTTGGNPGEQTYAYYRMDAHMVARLFWEGGKVVEYGTYAVSTDGRLLTVLSWNPDTPQYQNIQVFDRQ